MSALPKQEAGSVVSELPKPKGPGARLKAAREAKGLNLDKVAAQLHLKSDMLLALEADDYDHLPARVFVVGYLRNYARLVGLPAEAIIQALDQFLPVEEETHVELPKVGNASAGVFKPYRKSKFPFFSMFLFIASAVALFWAWQQDYFSSLISTGESLQSKFIQGNVIPLDVKTSLEKQNPIQINGQADDQSNGQVTDDSGLIPPLVKTAEPEAPILEKKPISEIQVPEKVTVPVVELSKTEEAVTEQEVAQSVSALSSVSEAINAVEVQTASVTSKVVVNETTQMAGPVKPEVVLSLTETCWIKVRDSAGEFRMNNNYKAGTVKTFAGEPPYNILIGNVKAASLTIDGEPFDLSGYTKQNVARLVLDPTSM